MALLMERDGLSRWSAAVQVASEKPGHSEISTAKRLDRKFREDSDSFVWLAREFVRAKNRQREDNLLLRSIKNRQREDNLLLRSIKKRAARAHGIMNK